MESNEFQLSPFDQNADEFGVENFPSNDSESDEDDDVNSEQVSRGNTAMSIQLKPDASEEKQKIDFGKQLLEEENAIAKETIRQLKARLLRRTSLVSDIRSYYLRDVVTIKQILQEVLAGTEKEAVMAEYAARLPSLDMTQHLTLHAPSNCQLRVTPCEHCGGRVDAVLADSDDVVRLKDHISIMKGKEDRLRLKVAELDAINERSSKEYNMNTLSHSEEKKVLYFEMKKLRDECKKHSSETEAAMQVVKKMRHENQRLQLEAEEILLSVHELAEARAEIRKLKNRLEDEVYNAKSQHEKMQLKIQDMNAIKAENRSLTTNFEGKSQELAACKNICAGQLQRLERVESENYALTQEKIFLTKRVSDLDDKLYFANQAIDDLSNMRSTFESTISEAKAQLVTEKASKEAVAIEIESMRQSLLSSTDEIQAMQTKLKAHNIPYKARRPNESRKNSFVLSPQQNSVDRLTLSRRMSEAGVMNGDPLIGSNSPANFPPSESGNIMSFTPLKIQSPMLSTHEKVEVDFNTANSVSSRNRRKTFPSDGFSFRKIVSSLSSVHHTDLTEIVETLNEIQLRNFINVEPPSIDINASEHGSNNVVPSQPLRNYQLKTRKPSSKSVLKEKNPSTRRSIESSPAEIPRPVEILSPLQSPKVVSSLSNDVMANNDDDMDVPNSNAGKLRIMTTASETNVSNKVSSDDIDVSSTSISKPQVQVPLPEPVVASKTIAVTKKPKAAFKVVELVPPTEDATPTELALRDSLIRTLSAYPDMTQNITHRVINASAPVLKKYSQLMTTCFECIMRSLSAKSQGLDYFSEVRKIFEGILRVAKSSSGPEEVETLRSTATASAESLMVGNKVHNQWRKESQIDEVLFKALDSCICNDEDGNEKSVSLDFFGTSKQELGSKLYSEEGIAAAVNLTLEAAEKMSNIAENSQSKFANDLVNVLQDWAIAKTAYVNMDNFIEVEKEKVRHELTVKLTAMTEELLKRKTMYENKCDQTDTLQEHLKSLLAVEKKMMESEKKIEKLEKDGEKYLDDMSKQSMSISELRSKLEVAATKLVESENIAIDLRRSLKLNVAKLKSEGEKIVELNHHLTIAIASRDDWQAQYNNLLLTEAERKAGMISIGIQFYPNVASINLQTEFLTLPTELHTAACNTLDRMGKVKYPLPLVHCSSPVKSIFDNNSLASSEASSTRTKTAFTAALRSNFNGGDLQDDSAAFHTNSSPSIILTTQSSEAMIDSARSNVSSASSMSSLTNSTQSYGFYNGNMHRVNSMTNRNLVPPPMYDLKTFLCGPTLAGPHHQHQHHHHHHHHNNSSNHSAVIMKHPSSHSVKSEVNFRTVDTSDDHSVSSLLTGNKHRGSSDGRGNIMPLTMELKNKFDSKFSTPRTNKLDVLNSPTLPVSSAASTSSLLQIGLPMVTRTGTSGSNQNAAMNTQTSRSVNLQSSRTHSDHNSANNIRSTNSNRVMNHGEVIHNSESSTRLSKDARMKSRVGVEDEKSVITLSNKSLRNAKQEYLSMV